MAADRGGGQPDTFVAESSVVDDSDAVKRRSDAGDRVRSEGSAVDACGAAELSHLTARCALLSRSPSSCLLAEQSRSSDRGYGFVGSREQCLVVAVESVVVVTAGSHDRLAWTRAGLRVQLPQLLIVGRLSDVWAVQRASKHGKRSAEARFRVKGDPATRALRQHPSPGAISVDPSIDHEVNSVDQSM